MSVMLSRVPIHDIYNQLAGGIVTICRLGHPTKMMIMMMMMVMMSYRFGGNVSV